MYSNAAKSLFRVCSSTIHLHSLVLVIFMSTNKIKHLGLTLTFRYSYKNNFTICKQIVTNYELID